MTTTEGEPTRAPSPSTGGVARPMIQITRGPSAGRIYPLDRRVTLIGRWDGSDVVLEPPTVSKRHAVIERSSTGFYLSDVASLAGTIVAGRPIQAPRRLSDGDTFGICDFTFTFLDGVATPEGPDDESTVAATINVSSPEPDRPAVPPEQKLRVLMEIGRDLGRALLADAVLERALDALLRIFPQAGRGAVFLKAESDGSPMARVVRCRSGRPRVPPTCRAILGRVIGGREAILSRDSPADFPGSRSVAFHSIRSLISAPLLDSAGQPLGAIQLDADEGKGRFEVEDLDLLVAVAGPVGIAVENANRHRLAIREAERDHELHLARRVLMDLLPKTPCEPPGYESFSHYEPARQVGGDYLGAFPVASPGDPAGGSPGRWALAVGDVSGHGMPAALFLARLSAEVRLVLKGEVDPARGLALLNEQIMATENDEFFVTFTLATLDARTHRFEAANAGHPAPLVRRAGGGPLERIGEDETGLPLAVRERCRYRAASTIIGPGDVVILLTDGVFESMNPALECLGLAELERVILAAPEGAPAVGRAILDAVRRHVGDGPQADDMTICCLGRPALAS